MTKAKAPEAPRILTVDTDSRWPGIVHKRLTDRKIEFERATSTANAIEQLNSGDFTAIIMDGLDGQWRMVAEEAQRLDVRPVVISKSTVAVHKVHAEGIAAFHTSSILEQQLVEPVIRAAVRSSVD